MSSDPETDPLIRLGVSANLASRYAADQRDFLGYLVSALEHAMPNAVEVSRKGGLFGPKRVVSVSLQLGDYLYRLDEATHGLQASRIKVVRGIKLKTEPLAMEEWLGALGEALEEQAHTSQAARNALESFFGG